MKTVFTIISIALINIACTSISELSEDTNQIDSGKCYSSISTNSASGNYKVEKSQILRISKPKFKTYRIKMTDSLLKEYQISETEYSIPVKEAYPFLNFNKRVENCPNLEESIVIQLCKLPVTEINQTFTLKQLQKSNYKVKYQKLHKNQRISKSYRKKQPKILKTNEMYIKSGQYTKLIHIPHLCTDYRERYDLIVLQIQKKLHLLGYDVELNNQYDTLTKTALTEYQITNKLEVGKLGYDTLGKLGIR